MQAHTPNARRIGSGTHTITAGRRGAAHFMGGNVRDAAEELLPPEWPRPTGALRFSGQISATGGIVDIVAMLAQTGQSGTLVVTAGDAVRALGFDGGSLVGAATTREVERIGEFLRQAGDVSRDELETAAYVAAIDGRPVGELLVETNRVDQATLDRMLRLQAEEIFFGALRVEEGAFCLFESLTVPRVPGEPRSLLSLLMEASRRMDEMVLYRRTVGSMAHVPIRLLYPADATTEVREDLRAVFDLCDGERSVGEIGGELGLFEFDVMSAIHQLAVSERIVVEAPRVRSTADILRVANTLLRDVHRRCDRVGAGNDLRYELAAFVTTTSEVAAMLRDIYPSPDGSLDPESVRRHTMAGSRDEVLERALRGYTRVAAERARALIASASVIASANENETDNDQSDDTQSLAAVGY